MDFPRMINPSNLKLGYFNGRYLLIISINIMILEASGLTRSATFGPKVVNLKHTSHPIATYQITREEDCLLHCVSDCNCLSVVTHRSVVLSCTLESGWTNDVGIMITDYNRNYTYISNLETSDICLCDHFYKNISCYRFFGVIFFTQSEAANYCKAMGMRLVSIETIDEYVHLIQIIEQIGETGKIYWTSAKRKQNSFRWQSSGLLLNIAVWAPSQPDGEDCVEISSNGYLYDSLCSKKRSFICEKTM